MATMEEGRADMPIPSKLPSLMTRARVTNTDTLKIIRTLANMQENKSHLSFKLDLASPDSNENNRMQQLLASPNGKIVTNIIRDFNTLAGTDYYISAAEIPRSSFPNIDFAISRLSEVASNS